MIGVSKVPGSGSPDLTSGSRMEILFEESTKTTSTKRGVNISLLLAYLGKKGTFLGEDLVNFVGVT